MLSLLAAIPGFGVSYAAAANIFASLLRCTLCMAAIAVGAAWIVGDIHGHRAADAAWTAKWDAAEAKAERDRLARDTLAKATIQADANDRLAGITARASELEGKVKSYEQQEELRRSTGGVASSVDGCLTNQSDDLWLRDIRKPEEPKPQARRGLAKRLRPNSTRSPDPGKR